MIKKFVFTVFLGLMLLRVSAQASSGTFGSGVELNINGTLTLYALDNGGTTNLKPTGSSATLNQTSWANGTEVAPVLNLGTFDPSLGQTLTLTGGSLLTFKNGGSNVTGAFLDFRVFTPQGTPTGAFTEISLPFNQDNVGGTGNQRWSTESAFSNLLAGLAPGNYELGVFLRATTDGADIFSSNFGANYGANFTVVPEASPRIFFGVPALLGILFLRRRRTA